MNKKIISLIMAAFIMVFACACSNGNKKSETNNEPQNSSVIEPDKSQSQSASNPDEKQNESFSNSDESRIKYTVLSIISDELTVEDESGNEITLLVDDNVQIMYARPDADLEAGATPKSGENGGEMPDGIPPEKSENSAGGNQRPEKPGGNPPEAAEGNQPQMPSGNPPEGFNPGNNGGGQFEGNGDNPPQMQDRAESLDISSISEGDVIYVTYSEDGSIKIIEIEMS